MQHALASAFGEVSPDVIDKAVILMESAKELILTDFLRVYSPQDWSDETRCRHVLHTSASWQAVLLYRISHALYSVSPKDPMLDLLTYIMRSKTGIEVYYSTVIGEGFKIVHGQGLVVGPRNRIGNNFTVYQGVTLGQRHINSSHECLGIGEGCIVFAGAKILGQLTIGNYVTIAANAVLLADAEDGGTYGGIPAKRI